MGYQSAIIVVDDVLESRKIYEEVFGLEVTDDHGIYNVGFANGLALYQRKLFNEISGLNSQYTKEINTVLYFEYENIQEIETRLSEINRIEFIHKSRKQPWGQYVLRAYDPDGHILEVGEDMRVCVKRMKSENLSDEKIAETTGYSVERVKELLMSNGKE